MKAQTLLEWLDDESQRPQQDLTVYTVEQPRIDQSFIDDLARRFDLQAEMQSTPDTYLMHHNSRMLLVYRASGAFAYSDFSRLHNSSYRPTLPTEAEAEKIAVSYLKTNGWWPKDAMLDGIHSGQFEQVSGLHHERRRQRANHICVDFRLHLDALSTYGAGAKIKVYLGHKGAVIGLFHAAPKVHKSREQRTITSQDLKTVLQRKLNVPLETIEVRNVTLAYLSESPLINTGFMPPAYVFTLAAPTRGARGRKPTMIEFMTHPIPATSFAPQVTIDTTDPRLSVRQDEALELTCTVLGGTAPLHYCWESTLDGVLSREPILSTKALTIAHRDDRLMAQTVKVTVTDAYGYQDSHQIAVRVQPKTAQLLQELAVGGSASPKILDDPNDPYVGVEWCNLYHGSAPDISGTDASARGFKQAMQSLPTWSSRFDWGNDTAWEEDFKFPSAAGGGTDTYWSDNVHFAFFAGHGSPGSFWFGSTVDDHEMRAQDSRWGDGILNWIVLHACQTMRANFEWTVWCDSFKGLHQMFGFHTNTEGSTPPLGSRFAFWSSFRMAPWMDSLDLQAAWRQACGECFDASVEYALIYANQAGTNTASDHLPGYGSVSADPTAPNTWVYYKGTC